MAERLRFYSSSADNLDVMAVDTDSSVATPKNVKSDYLFKDASTREIQIGTMPINPSVKIQLDPIYDGAGLTEYIIPEGYHDGTSRIYTAKLSDYTPGNATEEDVVNNKVFWVNGERKVGSLNVQMANQEATATADDLVEGKTAWVNKVKLTGTIPKLPRKDKILLAGESYTLPYGLSPGTSVISAASLADQTYGTAKESDILFGQSAWVNGEKVTGKLKIQDKIEEALQSTDATMDNVLAGKKFFSSVYNQIVVGNMPDHTGEAMRTIPIGYEYFIPHGYYDGYSKITTQSLSDATQASAIADNILNGKTAWVNGSKITGIMPFNDPIKTELGPGESYVIPKGYHTGNGSIVVNPIDKLTTGTATASTILFNRVAWVNGEKIIGTMPNNQDLDQEIIPGQTFYVPEGYHSGTGTVWVKPLKEFTPGDVEAKYITEGKVAWVNGEKVIGTMPSIEPEEIVLDAGVKFIIPEGYHDGTGTVEAETLENQTVADAKADDILRSKTAWVNGEKVTGTLELSGNAVPADVLAGSTFYNSDAKTKLTGTLSLTGNATEEDVLEGVYFYNNNAKRKLVGSLKLTGTAQAANVLAGTSFYNTDAKVLINGTMPNNVAQIIQLDSGTNYTIPKGYHDGTGVIKAPTVESVTPGDAEASDIYPGKTAWVNGQKITGTMTMDGNVTPDKVVAGYTFYTTNPKQKLTGTMYTIPGQIIKLYAGQEYTIPYGVHEGKGQVYAATLEEQTQADAVASNILITKTAWVNGEKIMGSMPNNGAITHVLQCGDEVSIPLGYHNGSGKVSAASLESQTVSDSVPENILIDKTAWVNGEMITGTMPDNEAVSAYLNCGDTYTVPLGYHNGTGVIVANSLASQTEADSLPENILVDKTAWVNGERISGTMPDNGAVSSTLLCGEKYFVPLGYHDGNGVIVAETLANQTIADAEAGDLLETKTAWVNGEKITGTIPKQSTSMVRINSGNDITLPAGYYPNGITIYSLYTDRLDLTGTDAWYESEDSSLHPESAGYVDGDSLVVTASFLA